MVRLQIHQLAFFGGTGCKNGNMDRELVDRAFPRNVDKLVSL